MFFDPDRAETTALSFADVRAELFAKVPKEMVSLYQNQHYFVIKATVAGVIKRWVWVSATSGVTNHPRQTVYLPPGFIVTGGGARANWRNAGNLLTGSYPLFGSIHGWAAEAKDHSVADPASVTVWVIGLEVEGIGPA
ncbi:Uncharacterized protein OS=Jaapia argillacea MUCL 33604 GN=JAAARDRAFT_354650 PE=4 SV=1 [Gemmata massiliana]|uniref:Uncharacterized protein n=1 Tax=Gemmata massiliana TaxID=1210884 RepID=A0A6P2CRB5_9BACT|nr:hypothetical protein [Gemmata massiliana]VTR91521.1 Uncharacterized protein OS=Jaapia argillacea MUCL 33604 GN=JAAARDRAFT_354650 PE=4 SV=1 [Gemmata massiliana]